MRIRLEAFERRVTGKPGHQNATPAELLAELKTDWEALEMLLRELEAARPEEREQSGPAAPATDTRRFVVGRTYQCRSIGDYDCIYSFRVIWRTEKFIELDEHGRRYKRGIFVRDGVEHCKPHGTYSMCAVIRADRECY